MGMIKVKRAIPHEECRRGADLPSLGLDPAGGQTTEVCVTHGHDVTPDLQLPSQRPGIEPATFQPQVQRSSHCTTRPALMWMALTHQ